jgi:hypothetical protein
MLNRHAADFLAATISAALQQAIRICRSDYRNDYLAH